MPRTSVPANTPNASQCVDSGSAVAADVFHDPRAVLLGFPWSPNVQYLVPEFVVRT